VKVALSAASQQQRPWQEERGGKREEGRGKREEGRGKNEPPN
jgi:hypothetical protein